MKKQLALFISAFTLATSANASHPALENEIVQLSKALPMGTPRPDGNGALLLGTRAEGKTLEVRLKVENTSSNWRNFWEKRVCSDFPARRILAMGGSLAIKATDSAEKSLGTLLVTSTNCSSLGNPITASEAQPSPTGAPSPQPQR